MVSSRAVGVGAFLVGGIILFSVALFLVGNRRMLFSDSFTVYTELRSLGGIQVGAGVRVAGMIAGEVKDIMVPLKPAAPFRLRLDVRKDLRPLVRTDSIVTVRTEGLVGAQFIQIGAGTEAAPRVEDGGTIRGQEPVEFADLLQQMGDTIRNVNETVALLSSNIQEVIGSIGSTAEDAHKLLAAISDDAQRAAGGAEKISHDVQVLLDGISRGQGTVGRLLKDDDLYRTVSTSVADAQRSLAALRQASEQTRDAVARLTARGGNVDVASVDLARTLASTRASMENVRDASEALKHNFLLRGFFNRRGYFNLEDISPAAYRQGALRADGRRSLRIWLRHDVVFEPGPGGTERLSETGKQRLDSAMAAFLDDLDDGPLMVEGYAPGVDSAAAFLTSQSRASLVREFLVSRYHLDPSSTGSIALGRRPPEGAGQDAWDGVALVLFAKSGNKR